MKLTKEQNEIADQQAQKSYKKSYFPELEKILYEAYAVLDHGL